MILHLYQRTITRNGKKIKAWYYWYNDPDTGKQIRRSCGTDGKPCLLKREAQEFIQNFNHENLKKDRSMTMNEYCMNLFQPGSDYLRWQEYKGHAITEKTRLAKQRSLDRFLSVFGETKIKDLKTLNIDKWLLKSDYTVCQKNIIIGLINEVYRSMYHDELISNLFKIDYYSYPKKARKGILSIDEIHKLFPENYDQIIAIWKNGFMTDYEAYQFATMMYLVLTTGMRSGELRALKWDQFISSDVILLNAMLDSAEKRVDHLKKGNDIDKKWRVVVLPSRTVNMINIFRNYNAQKYTDYIFEFDGQPIKKQYLLKHFHKTLENQGIDWKGRNLTIHSLRFTYNTIMKNQIDRTQLRLLMGHTNEKMTNYYDRSTALDNVPLLLQNKGTIDSVFN